MEVAQLEHVLREQWLRLRAWLAELDDAVLAAPSVLAGWTVEDLVAHVGRSMDALAVCQPAEPGAVPLTLGEYVATYGASATETEEATRAFAREITGDRLHALDGRAARAFEQLLTLRDLDADPVVRARRGPIRLSEMIVSRLVELVVHGDDLVRSLPRPATTWSGPLLPEAVHLVSEALLEVLHDRGGESVEVLEELPWIRLACGRTPYDVGTVATALRPTYTSDGLPDLGARLPLVG